MKEKRLSFGFFLLAREMRRHVRFTFAEIPCLHVVYDTKGPAAGMDEGGLSFSLSAEL